MAAKASYLLQDIVGGLREREVAASKAAGDCQEMLSELQDFAAHQQAQVGRLTQELEVATLHAPVLDVLRCLAHCLQIEHLPGTT